MEAIQLVSQKAIQDRFVELDGAFTVQKIREDIVGSDSACVSARDSRSLRGARWCVSGRTS